MSQLAMDFVRSTWPLMRACMDVEEWKFELPEEAQAALLDQLQTVQNEWKALGVSERDADAARFALCAFLDEQVSARSKFGLNWLSHSLVMKLFQDFAAGESFFVRLSDAQKNSSPALPIFLLCLISGYRGKYQFEDAKALDSLLDTLRGQCKGVLGNAKDTQHLFINESPGKLPKERSGKRWLIAAVCIGIFSVSVYIALMSMAQS